MLLPTQSPSKQCMTPSFLFMAAKGVAGKGESAYVYLQMRHRSSTVVEEGVKIECNCAVLWNRVESADTRCDVS